MSLNIKNEAVHELVRRLAELTGQSQTSAVEDAVRRRLEEVLREREAEVARRRTAIDAVVERSQRRRMTWADYEEVIDDMYDEQGLPR